MAERKADANIQKMSFEDALQELEAIVRDLESGSGKLDAAIDAGMATVVDRQIESGVDIVSDGEIPRISFSTYVADRMEEAMESGIDGFILQPVIQPYSHVEFVDMVVPELQRRGVLRREYEPGETLRERYLGKGQKLTRDDHPSAQFRAQSSRKAEATA